jgi:prepilin-type N-terminal cleavage/methylation domain-containing protein
MIQEGDDRMEKNVALPPNFRQAFTMIELIFVIVILGILASVAIPKLAATRDDARISIIAQNTMTAAWEVAAYATAKGQTETTLSAMSNAAKALIDSNDASESGTELTIGSIDNNDCLHLKIENQGHNTEVIKITYDGSGGNCDTLKSLIDASAFPIPLRGTLVSY